MPNCWSKELGRTELFIAVQRLSDAPMPRDVSGEVTIPAKSGPAGFRRVYLLACQIDMALNEAVAGSVRACRTDAGRRRA